MDIPAGTADLVASGVHAALVGDHGSGRTGGIVAASALLSSSGVAASGVLAVAPERRRADVLLRRISAAAPPCSVTSSLGLSLRIVRPARSLFPLKGDLSVLEPSERIAMLGFLPSDPPSERVRLAAEVDAARRDSIVPQGRAGVLMEAYEAAMTKAGRTDLWGMARFAASALSGGAVEGLSGLVRLLVDDWHDLSPCHRELVLLCARSGVPVTASTLPDGLDRLSLKPLHVVRLESDRRSPSAIAAAVSRVVPGRPRASRSEGGTAVVRVYRDSVVEAAAVGAAVARLVAGGAATSAVMVVAMNAVARLRVCAALVAAGVPVRVSGGDGPFDDERARLVSLFLSTVFSQPATSASGLRAESVRASALPLRVTSGAPDTALVRAACVEAVGSQCGRDPDIDVGCLVDCLCVAAVADRFAGRLSALAACWKTKDGVALHGPGTVSGSEAAHVFVCGLDLPADGTVAGVPDPVVLTRSTSHLGLTAALVRGGPRAPVGWLADFLACARRGEVAGSLEVAEGEQSTPLVTSAERSVSASPLDFEGPGVRRLAVLR